MKCLSLWQPWASLLVTGHKCVETRSWPISHRGPLLIHAAKKWNGKLAELCLSPPFRDCLAEFGVPGKRHDWVQADLDAKRAGWGMGFGAILGRVDVVDCVPTHSVAIKGKPEDAPGFFEGWLDGVLARHLVINATEQAFGDYTPGRFAIICTNPVRFEKPIPRRGFQGLFEVPDELLKDVA